MNDLWRAKWDDRYRNPEYAFGTSPNLFLKEHLESTKTGKVLFAAEGEGRNAVYAAKIGWEVSAFDISEEGRKKALQLADENHVRIDYRIGQLPELSFTEGSFDALILIFAHFPAKIKSEYHQYLARLLKPGGLVVFEAYSKKHLPLRQADPKVGGPDNLDDLFSIEEIEADFEGFNFDFIEEREIMLSEGLYHQGCGSVIRFVAERK